MRLIYHRDRLARGTPCAPTRPTSTTILRAIAAAADLTLAELMAMLPQCSRGRAAALAATEAPAAARALRCAHARRRSTRWRRFGRSSSGSSESRSTTTSSISAAIRCCCCRRTAGCARRLRPDLPIVALLQYPTIRALARHLSGAGRALPQRRRRCIERAQKQREALLATQRERARASHVLLRQPTIREEGIAIVGMAGRFPGARNVARAVAQPAGGRESIAHFRADELEPAAAEDMAARARSRLRAGARHP